MLEAELSGVDQRPDEIPGLRARLEEEERKRHKSPQEWARTRAGELEREVRAKMEKEFRRLGDEGLLDFLASLPERGEPDLSRQLLRQSADLATDLRDRRLFKVAERVGAGDVSSRDLFEEYGAPVRRAEIEADAQQFAGLDDAPKVILWIPPPNMRLKLANVLVQQKSGIAPFVKLRAQSLPSWQRHLRRPRPALGCLRVRASRHLPEAAKSRCRLSRP